MSSSKKDSGSRPRPPNRTSLEHQLALLEARFTGPLADMSPSEATINPLSSPNVQSHHSHHSYGFDPPCELFQSPAKSNTNSNSERKGKGAYLESINAVNAAAERHMAKVLKSPDGAGFSQSSNQTLVTSHRTVKIKETPPQRATEKRKNDEITSSASPKVSFHSLFSLILCNIILTRRMQKEASKRKSKPTKFTKPSVKDQTISAPTNKENAQAKRKRGRQAVGSPLRPQDSTSLDRSMPGKRRSVASSEPQNSTSSSKSLYAFFKSAKVKPVSTDAAIVSESVPGPTQEAGSSVPKPKLSTTSNKAVNEARSLDSPGTLESLEQQVQELQRSLDDKDEQLRAVANNRTILHSALKSALNKSQEELKTLKNEHVQERQQVGHVLERMVRQRAQQEATDLRQELASQGTRLGRIITSRAGLSVVETWEDGQASKILKDEQRKLLSSRQEMELRLQRAKDAQDDSSLSELRRMEAIESVKYHLKSIGKKEADLREKQAALHEEKGAHIRALKRIASEDASRFRNRPKLHDRYVLQALLGKGGFSEVWKAYDLHSRVVVAVKLHQLDPRWPEAKKENYTKHVSREYEIHRHVRHDRIVSLLDVFEIDNNSFATVLELCDGSDLDTLLKQKRCLPEQDARVILLQMLCGMMYLSHPSEDGSRQGIIHYDLKPGNILFDTNGDAKITDFGLSKIVDAIDEHQAEASMELTSQGAGTYWYLPPECFVTDDNVRISNKVDVWSIGVIYYQMLFGRRPFAHDLSQDKLLSDKAILHAEAVQFPKEPKVSKEAKEFISACLTADQVLRPTIAQICKHPYTLLSLTS